MKNELIPISYYVSGSFHNADEIIIESRKFDYENKSVESWAVLKRGNSLNNKTFEFDYEPMPSSRTDAWLKKHRFTTLADAIKAIRNIKPKQP